MIEWTDILACPKCLGELVHRIEGFLCPRCRTVYTFKNGVVSFSEPPDERKEWLFETARYDRIAKEAPKNWGLDETYPDVRNTILKEKIGDAPMYLNIGQGFGGLEEIMSAEKSKVCLDQSLAFLKRVQEKHIFDTWLVQGYAERMPFKSDIFPCVVSDSVFQTVTDQKEFLYENARVLKKGGTFILATAYKWNYPRKPQLFPVSDWLLLKHFLHELGIEATSAHYKLASEGTWRKENPEPARDIDAILSRHTDYFVVTGTKE